MTYSALSLTTTTYSELSFTTTYSALSYPRTNKLLPGQVPSLLPVSQTIPVYVPKHPSLHSYGPVTISTDLAVALLINVYLVQPALAL